jgi:hypothetical protein
LIEIRKQGALDDVLVTETFLECEPPKPLILGLRQAECQRLRARLLAGGDY